MLLLASSSSTKKNKSLIILVAIILTLTVLIIIYYNSSSLYNASSLTTTITSTPEISKTTFIVHATTSLPTFLHQEQPTTTATPPKPTTPTLLSSILPTTTSSSSSPEYNKTSPRNETKPFQKKRSSICRMIASPNLASTNNKKHREAISIRKNKFPQQLLSREKNNSHQNNEIFYSYEYNYPGSEDGGINKLAFSPIFDVGRSDVKKSEWPYTRCPVKHKIICDNHDIENDILLNDKSNPSDEKEKESRALVIYMVSSSNDPHQRHQENKNLNYFLRNGLVPPNTSTALFDSVDFVFAKAQVYNTADVFARRRRNGNQNRQKKEMNTNNSSNSSSEEKEIKKEKEEYLRFLDQISSTWKCSSSLKQQQQQRQRRAKTVFPSNIKFLLLPNAPCDLCSHSRVMDLYFIKKENNKNNNTSSNRNDDYYSHVFMLNSGVAGPFFEADDDENHDDDDKTSKIQTTWLDFVAMAGRETMINPRQQQRQEQQQKEEQISVSTSISWQGKLHHQTFFLAAPISIIRKAVYPLFRELCYPTTTSLRSHNTKNKVSMRKTRDKHSSNNNSDKDDKDDDFGYFIPTPHQQREKKGQCILRGEIQTGQHIVGRYLLKERIKERNHQKLMKSNNKKNNNNNQMIKQNHDVQEEEENFLMYDLSRQFYVRNNDDDSIRMRNKYNPSWPRNSNPFHFWSDPCKGVFPKLGGRVHVGAGIPFEVYQAVEKMTSKENKKVVELDLMSWEDVESVFDDGSECEKV